MNSWPSKKMPEITHLVTDGKHGDCNDEQNSGYFFLSSKDLRDGKLNYDNPRQIMYSDFLETHRRTNLEPGDILLANCGASIGRIGIAQDDPRIYKTTFQKSISVIKSNKSFVDGRYLYYFLLCNSDLLIHLGNGTAQPNLLIGDLKRIEVPIPPNIIQQRIAAILSAYDNLIKNNLRRINILEEIAQNLYIEWFVKFRFPGHEKIKMVDSPMGMIPEGWEIKTLNTFGVVVTGKTPSKARVDYYDTFMPFIKIPDMHNNLFISHAAESLSELGASSQKEKTIPADSICVSCIGTAGLVGITTTSAQTNQQINSIVLKDLNYREFLYFAVLGLKEIINQYGANGVTMVNLNKGKFEKLTVLCPLDELLFAYHENIKSVFNEIRCLHYKNSNLRRSRDLLLPRLISGELDVSDLDIKTGDDE